MFLNIAHCFLNGKKYELQVYNIVKKCKLNNHFFNLQNETDLGGYDSKNDIECIMEINKCNEDNKNDSGEMIISNTVNKVVESQHATF